LAFVFLITLVGGLPVAAFSYQHFRTVGDELRVIYLDARLPEKGGWLPESIRIQAGERVKLRISSPDVVHSFAIGRTDVGPIDVIPGKVAEIEFQLDEPGAYTFFCTRWCSTNHWRMRGTLEVLAQDGTMPVPVREPAPYLALGINLDEGHGDASTAHASGDSILPPAPPSAAAGAALGLAAPEIGIGETPVEIHHKLQLLYPALSPGELWALVAYGWEELYGDSNVAAGEALYARDCAACHGQTGLGDGVMARGLPEEPDDWVGAGALYRLSDAHLHGKIVRGGMGTGMPGWGDVYTEQQSWDLVAFLRSLAFSNPSATP
jgi:mono/diheme cytochrome c family protein